jgi:hypothetical protein
MKQGFSKWKGTGTFDQAPVGILIIDAETAVPVEFNEVAHQQLGYTKKNSQTSIFDYKGETPDEKEE